MIKGFYSSPDSHFSHFLSFGGKRWNTFYGCEPIQETVEEIYVLDGAFGTSRIRDIVEGEILFELPEEFAL